MYNQTTVLSQKMGCLSSFSNGYVGYQIILKAPSVGETFREISLTPLTVMHARSQQAAACVRARGTEQLRGPGRRGEQARVRSASAAV